MLQSLSAPLSQEVMNEFLVSLREGGETRTTESVFFDGKAAVATGKVLGSLARAGVKIGDFDSFIAGHALSLNARLATKNPHHFRRVEGLTILEWP